MSRYVGFAGEAIIKEEYREDFLNLYNRKYSRMKTEIMRKYVKGFGYSMLYIKNWNNHQHNGDWDEPLTTSYDEEKGLFTYKVTVNFHNAGLFECIDLFIYVLTQISDEVVPYKVWDEYEEMTKKNFEDMRDISYLDMEDVNSIEIEDMEDVYLKKFLIKIPDDDVKREGFTVRIIEPKVRENVYLKKFFMETPVNGVKYEDFTIRIYKNEKNAAILETDGGTYGFEVIAEITENGRFYSDAAIEARDGKLLTFEIERRWLVKIPENIGDFRYESIEQDYLESKKGFQERIRRLDDKFFYTEKARTENPAVRIENEHETNEETYLAMKKHKILNTIKKKRYLIPSGNHTFELDVFENTVESGIGIMEVELASENEIPHMPEFVEIIQEVTNDSYYTNRNFASMEKIRLIKE